MEAFTSPVSVNFSAQLDSKGRITIPARIRNRLDLEKGDRISLRLESKKLVQEEVENYREALRFVNKFESVSSFSYTEGTVEVILNG